MSVYKYIFKKLISYLLHETLIEFCKARIYFNFFLLYIVIFIEKNKIMGDGHRCWKTYYSQLLGLLEKGINHVNQ